MLTRRTVLLVVLSCCLSSPCQAQAPGVGDPIVDVGIGLGLASQGFGGQLHLGVGTPIGDVILRGAGTTEIAVFETPESAADVALLYGRSLTAERGWLRAGVGVGLVESVRRGAVIECAILIVCRYEEIKHRSTGLALQLDAVWALSSPFGLGLGAFGNINSAGSFGGAVVSLHFGRLRSP